MRINEWNGECIKKMLSYYGPHKNNWKWNGECMKNPKWIHNGISKYFHSNFYHGFMVL